MASPARPWRHDRASSARCSIHGFPSLFLRMHKPVLKATGPNVMVAARRLQKPAADGVNVQPSSSIAKSKTGVRLRRRLSAIFHRESHDSTFVVRPSAPGTSWNSHEAICQSPRIQRCRRLASARTRAGTLSNNSTSPTKPLRAKQPSIRSWLKTRLSGNRPATAASHARTS